MSSAELPSCPGNSRKMHKAEASRYEEERSDDELSERGEGEANMGTICVRLADFVRSGPGKDGTGSPKGK
jgi:hypothetical protein